MKNKLSKSDTLFEISEPKREDDEQLARFAVDRNGQIVYSNKRLRDLIAWEEETDISNAIILDTGASLETAQDGEINLTFTSKNISLPFHLNWTPNAKGKTVLIGSEIRSTIDEGDLHDREAIQSFFQTAKTITTPHDLDGETSIGSLKQDTDPLQFINMSNDIMIVSDEQGNILRANNTFYNLLKYTKGELEDIRFTDLFESDDRSRARTFMQTLTTHDGNKPEIIDFEGCVLSKTGTQHRIEWRQRFCNGFLYSVGRDVSAIKEHEQKLDKRENQLTEAEIIGRMGHWRWVIGQDDIEWSEQIYRIFGVKRASFAPTIDTLNGTIHRRDVGRVIQAFQRAIIEQNDYDMEFRIIHPGGEIRHIRCEGRCERDEDGEVIALYGIMQDMTERMLYERELKEAKDAAERAYAAKSQFLANMSHELRTPLNAVIGFSEMMQRQLLGPIGTEKYLDYINGIRESGEHLLDLISDILDMSKIEAGKHKLDVEDVNIVKLIRLTVHMMEGRALDSNVKIDCSAIEKEEIIIKADRRAIMQVLLNLLSNAIKFSKEDGHVWIECHEGKDSISIAVRDNGIGIPANKLSSITNPFEQASSSYSRNHEGSGLGLAITKELVQMHSGRLLIDSTADIGTTVTVKLPYNTSA